MKSIYLVDYLGVHCGMHYYLEAFKVVLSGIPNTDIKILSNYQDIEGEKPFFHNQYIGSLPRKAMMLLLNMIALWSFIRRHRNDVFVFLTYGNGIDLFFIRLICQANRHIIDVHEAIAQCVDNDKRLKSKLHKLYGKRVKTVISHSGRTDEFLMEYGYSGQRLYVPHFKYVFPKKYDSEALGSDVKDAYADGMVNLLFFGNVNESKGIDILLEAVNRLDAAAASKLNVVIAGKDFDGAWRRVPVAPNRRVHFILRHISDDELRYLYQKADYLALPYRKTSQSGILEMAFYFKKPIIATNIPYFEKTLAEFPSFGLLAGNGVEDYSSALSSVVSSHDSKYKSFFDDSDYARYENRREVEAFKFEFERWLIDNE